jgi:hypothetical protein
MPRAAGSRWPVVVFGAVPGAANASQRVVAERHYSSNGNSLWRPCFRAGVCFS